MESFKLDFSMIIAELIWCFKIIIFNFSIISILTSNSILDLNISKISKIVKGFSINIFEFSVKINLLPSKVSNNCVDLFFLLLLTILFFLRFLLLSYSVYLILELVSFWITLLKEFSTSIEFILLISFIF